MVENQPLPDPPSGEEAFMLLNYSNPNFVSKPKEERIEGGNNSNTNENKELKININ